MLLSKLKAITFAKANSNEAAARKFRVDPKRIREWRSKEEKLKDVSTDKSWDKKRIKGGGRKPQNASLVTDVVEWISSMRKIRLRVSRKMVMKRAAELYEAQHRQPGSKEFVASRGWLETFLRCNNSSLRRETTVSVTKRCSAETTVVHRLRQGTANQEQVHVWQHICYGWNYRVVGHAKLHYTIEKRYKGSPEPYHRTRKITVCLTARATGKKLKPLIVLKVKEWTKIWKMWMERYWNFRATVGWTKSWLIST